MNRITIFIQLAAALLVCGCFGPIVGVHQVGMPRAPKPADCSLDFVTVTPADMAPGAKFGMGGEFEMIGGVAVGADSGTSAVSEEIKALVRPRACSIGGDAISLLASGGGANAYGRAQQNIVFQVWARRQAAPATPQKF
jgi:hypothetical protein